MRDLQKTLDANKLFEVDLATEMDSSSSQKGRREKRALTETETDAE